MEYIYLDNAATTPTDARVVEAMLPYYTEVYGNADSRHAAGRKAALAVLASRDNISSLIGGKGGDLYFTSGGSEANSWALKGVCMAQKGKNNRIILSAIEHSSLLNAAEDMKVFGYETSLVYPDATGKVHPESVKTELEKGGVAFVGVMAANNETGVIQPVEEIYSICRQAGVFFFCDCVQTAGSLPINCGIADAISISAHKFYGPKGVGALWLKKDFKISRLISGGQQESGLRGGTTNVAGVCGMSHALSIACSEMEKNAQNIRAMRDRFLNMVLYGLNRTVLVGDEINRLCCNANIMFKGCSGEELLIKLDISGVAASAGSACSSGASKPSYVLTAMGMSQSQAASCVRFTFGKDNTLSQAEEAAQRVIKAVNFLRQK